MVLRRQLAIATAVGLTLAATAQAESPDGHLLVAQPGAEAMTRYHDVLPWKPLEKPRRLPDGQRLHCRKPCRVSMDDGSSVLLAAGATVVASSPMFFRFEANSLAQRSQVVRLLTGEISVVRGPSQQKPLVVELPNRRKVAILGTGVRIKALRDGVVVATPESGVSVRQKAGWLPLAPASAHHIGKKDELQTRPLVTTPSWDASDEGAMRPIALAATRHSAVVAGSWKEVPGASLYRVEIATDAHFAQVVKRIVVEAPDRGFRASLPEGSFYARVVAVDPDGLDTAPSQTCRLRVIRAVLPAGGFVANESTLVLPEGQPMRLLSADDIELSVDKSGFWKAPDKLPGPTQTRHRLRFRLAGDANTTTVFSLERRALEALVTLTPGAPIWPQDTIDVTVHLVDRTGRIDVTGVTPHFEVKLGGTSLPVTWRKAPDAHVWRARVKSRPLDGPSLMEVIARDAAGVPIGWGFVELVAGLDTRGH